MAIFKKSIIIILCATLAFSPLLYCGDFSYADDIPDEPAEWTTINPDDTDLVCRAALLFLRAQQFVYTKTGAGLITKWTYDELQRRCNDAGISMTELSQQIKYKVDNSGKYTFYFTQGAAITLNNLWESMMTAYGLGPNEFKKVYSGKTITMPDGEIVQCFIAKNNNFVFEDAKTNFYNSYDYFGGTYKHSGYYYRNAASVAYPNWNSDGSVSYTNYTWFDYQSQSPTYGYQTFRRCGERNNVYTYEGYIEGYDCIIYNKYNHKYYVGTYMLYNRRNSSGNFDQQRIQLKSVYTLNVEYSGLTPADQDINANQGNTDNNIPENSPFTISEPDDDEDEPVVEPFIPPEPPTDPYVPNPTGGNEDENGNFNWHMPDINVDWDLGDFSDIFPFSIPYDIIELFDIVDSEPVTPAIYQEVDFGAFNYTIDFDLSYFDEFMEYVRAMELFLYTMTLFIATRGVFKIY